MTTDKQELLRRFRRGKRIMVLVVAVAILSAGPLVGWWLPLPLALLAWFAHEVWFSDHQFYPARQDYRYTFPEGVRPVLVTLGRLGELVLEPSAELAVDDTLLLEVRIKSGWLGCFFDPGVIVTCGDRADVQIFERNARGVRYVNLTGCAEAIREARLKLAGRYCRIDHDSRLWVFNHADYASKRLLIVAPHADDAELAAFGLYSRARDSWIVTLTAGEVETGHYRRMGCSAAEAARLKGCLRAWDSIAVPRWGGVPEEKCVHFGYFCLQLPTMQALPDTPAGSREADLCDTRIFRAYNRFPLPSDRDGLPTWENLKSDLRHVVDLVKPEVIVLPHPSLDPHPDHVSAYNLVNETLAAGGHRPDVLLCYANHLHDNDRWPMGNAHSGVPLPPRFTAEPIGSPYSLVVEERAQRDKAMALGMMHDLRTPLPLKKRLRRSLQTILTGRRWPLYGEDEFFRKAVRRHELFWAMPLS